jgi:hypothetical protein
MELLSVKKFTYMITYTYGILHVVISVIFLPSLPQIDGWPILFTTLQSGCLRNDVRPSVRPQVAGYFVA